MHLKRFNGPSVPDVMRQIREALGPDAVILHTRSSPERSGLRFVGGRGVEILAAVDRDAPAPPGAPAPVTGPPAPRPVARPTGSEDLRADVLDIKRLLVRLSGERALPPGGGPVLEGLVATGLEETLAYAVVQAVAPDDLAAPELALIEPLLRVLGDTVPIAPGALHPRAAAVAVVGPAGSGKTTLVAKLAAQAHLRGGHVRLLSADAGMLGAPSPLEAFARILGVPFVYVGAPEAMRRALGPAASAPPTLTLIDTPALGAREDAGAAPVAAVLAAARPGEVHLVLSATDKPADASRAARHARATGATHLALTRLDESRTLGSVPALARDVGLPLSYFGVGRGVPDDVQSASLIELARRVVADATSPRRATGAPAR